MVLVERSAENRPLESPERPSPPMLIVSAPGPEGTIIVEDPEVWRLVRAVLNRRGEILTQQDVCELVVNEKTYGDGERLREVVGQAMTVLRTAAVSDPGIEIFGDEEEMQSVFVDKGSKTKARRINTDIVLAELLGTSSPTNGQVQSAPPTAVVTTREEVPATPAKICPLRADLCVSVGVTMLAQMVTSQENGKTARNFPEFVAATGIQTEEIGRWPSREVQHLVLEGVMSEILKMWDVDKLPTGTTPRQMWRLIERYKKEGYSKKTLTRKVYKYFHLPTLARRIRRSLRETPAVPGSDRVGVEPTATVQAATVVEEPTAPATAGEAVGVPVPTNGTVGPNPGATREENPPPAAPPDNTEAAAGGSPDTSAATGVVYQAPPGGMGTQPQPGSGITGGPPPRETSPSPAENPLRADQRIRLGARLASILCRPKSEWETTRSLGALLSNIGVQTKGIQNWPAEEAQQLILEGALVEIFRIWDSNSRAREGEAARMWSVIQELKRRERTGTKENIVSRACDYFHLSSRVEEIKKNLLATPKPA